MKFLSLILALTLLAAGAGALLADDDHGGPGNEAGSGSSEHPGHKVEGPKDSPSAAPSVATTAPASPSPSPSPSSN
jgi:hypothetical protein